MRIKAHIYALESNGETLKLKAQGTAVKAPEWMQNMCSVELSIPATKANEKAFYMGRNITVEVKPQ